MKFHNKTIENVTDALGGNLKKGLLEAEVEKHREMYGVNQFEDEEKESLVKKIAQHLIEVMNLILLFATGLSLYISLKDSSHGFAEPIVIFVILIINIAVSIYQEGQAESALASLKSLSSPRSTVIRDGKKTEIDSADLVVGDILVLSAGDQIAADIRLFEANNLQIDEASLTGESLAINKDAKAMIDEDAALGDQINMAFSGTIVLNGNGLGLVVAVGMQSQTGRIAGLLTHNVKEKTPLQKRIDHLAKQLAVLAFIAGFFIFVINMLTTDIPFFENVMIAVTLAIAAVPETLPVIVTLTLAYGVTNIAGRQAIIRNIPAVETLGSASIIASDKTGTLTQNKMVIQRLWMLGHDVYAVTDEAIEGANLKGLRTFGLASNASVTYEDGQRKYHGDPTEVAIMDLLLKQGIDRKTLDDTYDRIFEIPFDSTRKLMTTVYKHDGKYHVLTKGAFDAISKIVTNKKALDDASYETIHDQFANDALRVLALGYKILDDMPQDNELDTLEDSLTFLGIVGMIDPPRKESKQAVMDARRAGIKTIMITGDHVLTATAIAKEIGIFQEGDETLTGAELARINDDDFIETIEKYSVYARVSPEDKIRIVKAWQRKGHVVAMTGDGVNDAPSLNAANVGTAMGIAGTEVAKNASDMILTDDNFATIVHAVEEGRRVYGNIKKTVYYLLSANVAEIVVMVFAAVIGWGAPLSGIQLLFINVLADGVPGFGLSREIADEGIMDETPIGLNESLFSRGGYRRIITAALTFTVVSLIAFYIGSFVKVNGFDPSHEIGQTLTFLVLGLSSTIHIFVARSNEPIIKSGIFANPTIFWTGLFSVALTIIVVAKPAIGSFLGLAQLSPTHWMIGISLSMLIILVIELEKVVLKKMGRKFIA